MSDAAADMPGASAPTSPAKRSGFPPGVGWVQAAVAGAVLLAVSAVAVVPHYTKQLVSSSVVGRSGPGSSGGPGATGTQGATGTAGSYVEGSAGRTVGGTAEPTAAGGGSGGSGGTGAACAASNGGSTAPGVTDSSINVASTIVTSGVGAGFLGQAQDGMQAAINQVNGSGGVCGRKISLTTLNSGWDYQNGGSDISSWISSGNYFALVGEPDSEGLSNAIDSKNIDDAGIPVVGTDGMLADQYHDPWVWPVAASTVTNMHVIAQYAVSQFHLSNSSQVGIVFDTAYKFGTEGAKALDGQISKLTDHKDIPGYNTSGNCQSQYCGISSQSQDYTSQINTFDSACANKCVVVVMLLEPSPMETWMNGEESAGVHWFQYLFGGEPLFDDNVANNCNGCGQAPMRVWTGYQPAIGSVGGAVAQFCSALHAVAPADDCHNEFTEGAYLGAELFIAAVEDVAAAGEKLTRANLQSMLDSKTFDLGLTASPISYPDASLHLANKSMEEFEENFSGSFNGWTNLNTGFITDSDPTSDL